jgi:hypothetical protein
MRDSCTQSRAGFISRRRLSNAQPLRPLLLALLTFCLCLPDIGAAPLALSAPSRVPGQFQFSVSGQAGSPYIVESSTNLQSWKPAYTNREPAATDTLLLSAPGERNFYRAFAATPLFAFALAAQDRIDVGGNNLLVDSFDSSDPLRSTNGLYDASKSQAGGDIGAYFGIAINTNGNADIFGHIWTGPGASVEIGPQASVGDIAWHSGNNKGIEPGFLSINFDANFPPVSLPFSGGFTPSGGVYNGTNYDYVLVSGNYRVNGSFLASNKTALVLGNVSLYVLSNFWIVGRSSILIVPGASLKLYVGGSSTALGGNGVLNYAGNATNFMYYGTTNNTSLSIGTDSAFIGTIYAPSAAITINTGGSLIYDFAGSCIGKSIRLYGHFNIHFDENLKRVGPFH